MIGAGTLSALLGFNMGSQALKGVSQPDASPTKKLIKNDKTDDYRKDLVFLKENDIIGKFQKYISDNKDKKPEPISKEQKQEQEKKDTFIKSNDDRDSSSVANFPFKSEDGGIKIEIVKASQQDNSLVLDVNLKNDSQKDVRFLYSFLDIRDERGRVLSAITDGLPDELSAGSDNFTGTVRIPTALLDGAKQLSLTLTDYPDQKIQLKIADIPVPR
jgi:hypothetical protein